jgi:hypothetical protein
MRSSISAAPSSAALAYFSCHALRSSATVSRAIRRSSLSFSVTSGAGISSGPSFDFAAAAAVSLWTAGSSELGGAGSDEELGSTVEEVTSLEMGVAEADDAADVGFVRVESAFAAVLLSSFS